MIYLILFLKNRCKFKETQWWSGDLCTFFTATICRAHADDARSNSFIISTIQPIKSETTETISCYEFSSITCADVFCITSEPAAAIASLRGIWGWSPGLLCAGGRWVRAPPHAPETAPADRADRCSRCSRCWRSASDLLECTCRRIQGGQWRTGQNVKCSSAFINPTLGCHNTCISYETRI